jgi:hypothetical protein
MGQVIRKQLSSDAIFVDASKTLTNATARGGRWNELAALRLGPSCTMYADMAAQLELAEQQHAPNAAALAMRNLQADRAIGKVYDTMWNEVGRPGTDTALSVIFPEGYGSYADGDTDEQPERMAVLVTLLEAGLHPKLSKETANACAAEMATEAALLESAVTAARKTGAKVKVFSRVRTALGKVVQAELANLKRLYKAEGFSEAEIHGVIPDRPSKTKKPEAA